jgi:hypothetical protein
MITFRASFLPLHKAEKKALLEKTGTVKKALPGKDILYSTTTF